MSVCYDYARYSVKTFTSDGKQLHQMKIGEKVLLFFVFAEEQGNLIQLISLISRRHRVGNG